MPCFGLRLTGRTRMPASSRKMLGATLKEVDIREAVTIHFRDIEQDPSVHDVTYENSQARQRTLVLMNLANKIGGYSGPGIMPVALRMAYEVCHSVDVPVIGMGGISTFEDALQFIMAGAEAVAVGTANFHNPYATVEIIDGIRQYMKEIRFLLWRKSEDVLIDDRFTEQ